MTTQRHASPVLACVALLTLLAACGGAQPAAPRVTATPSAAATQANIASASPASEPSGDASATAQASPSGAAAYVSDGFVLPLGLTPPSWANEQPDAAEPNFITWVASDMDLALRVMVPVSVYRPGQRKTSEVPADYLAYLDTLTDSGVTLADRSTTTVAGQPATLVTITTDVSVDGALGCPSAGTPAGECYGAQPDLALRFAVIDVDGTPLLVWLRTVEGSESSAAIAEFEDTLQSIELR
jgi:hypothetical protein